MVMNSAWGSTRGPRVQNRWPADFPRETVGRAAQQDTRAACAPLRIMDRRGVAVEKNIILAKRPRVARDPWTRVRGMIGRDFLDFDALIFPGCRAVHTCLMGMALDLLFVDAAQRVVAVKTELR